MTINHTFTDWRPVPLGEPFNRDSPALQQLLLATGRRYGCRSLGCYHQRPVRGSSAPSVHSWGAAIDIGYRGSRDANVREMLCGYLVGNSAEWGVSAVHDYVGQRIWRAGRTNDASEACSGWWRAQRRDSHGMGQTWAKWLHVEVTRSGWMDPRSESDRGIQ